MDYNGFHRAKVINANDPEQYGRVQVWIPDLMQKVSDNQGLWANPANNPISGLNSDGSSDHHYMGSSYIPQKGSWIWVFFENARPERPYYFAGLDLKNTKVLPENRTGSLPYRKWVIFKSNEGRSIVISDDPDDERVQITGKKRQLSNPPSGDVGSVSTIIGNQTTILLSEIDGEQQLLIETYLGDFIKIDIDERTLTSSFESDISEISKATISENAKEDITETAGGDITENATGNINNTAGGDINQTATGNVSVSGNDINQTSGGDTNIIAGGTANITAPTTNVIGTLLVSTGATGTFISLDGKQITVVAGIITEISG